MPTPFGVRTSAEFVPILGKVSDGSRLLELQPVDRYRPSFFAGTSNVLPERDPGS